MEPVINNWKVIKTENEYDKALDRLEFIFDAVPGSEEFNEAELLGLLIKDYEDRNYPISLPDPIEAIKIKIEELGLQNSDLVPILGSEEHILAILSKQEELTLEKARGLHYWLDIPSDVFIDLNNGTINPINGEIITVENRTIKASTESKIMRLKQLSLK